MAVRVRHPIKCSRCNWKGARRVGPMTKAMGGGACPGCGASRHYLEFVDAQLEAKNREYNDKLHAALEEARQRDIKETEERLKTLRSMRFG
jgi:hypothetical protein